MTQQKIARMKCLHLEAGAVTRDEEPVAILFLSSSIERMEGNSS
jgi:hypothetical protein